MSSQKKQYIVTGMTCAACQSHVEKAVQKVSGVEKVSVSLLTNSMTVIGDVSDRAIEEAVKQAGYGATSMNESSKDSSSDFLQKEEEALQDHETPKLKKRLLWSILFLVLLMYITMGHNMLDFPVPSFWDHNHLGLGLTQLLLALAVMGINRAFFISGYRSLLHGAPNMDVLVALGSGVSFTWSLYVYYKMTWLITQGISNMDIMDIYHDQLYFESAAMIPALITVGKLLESISKGRTTDALKHLMKMAPQTARIKRDGELVTVGIGEVKRGDIFVVKPGESVPVDGIIVEGRGAMDESALTGESVPVDKIPGDLIRSASINTNGYIEARAERVGEDTTFAQIIRMVSEASATKAPIARLADTVSGVFVPGIVLLAVIVFLVHLYLGSTVAASLEFAICVLVISCPCALGLATPVAIMVGSGLGAKQGILFKTSEAMEIAGKAQIVALDKTGTITEGKPQVTDVLPASGISDKELWDIAYGLEKQSEHPLAKAIVEAAKGKEISTLPVEDFHVKPGEGLSGRIGNDHIYGGSLAYISSLVHHSSMEEEAKRLSLEGKTPLFFAKNQTLLGCIAVADVIRPDSKEAIEEFHHMGLEVVMLTGDNEVTAKAIGEKAGVDHILAGVLPDGKEAVIRDLQKKGKVIMIGDGINDAPALARADIGMAIGNGTDVAMDSADIVLMNSRLTDGAAAIRLSRKTVKNIHENLFWAFIYNILLIPAAAGLYPGITMNPMWGAAAMSLSSVTVCLNALRLNLFSPRGGSRKPSLPKKVISCGEEQRKLPLEEEPKGKEETIAVAGMMCENCEKHVKKALEALPGILGVTANYHTGEVKILYRSLPAESDIKHALSAADYEYKGIVVHKEETTMKETVTIKGMMCNHCEAAVKKALEALDGVEKAEVSHVTGTAVLTLSHEVADEAVKKAVEDKDYTFVGIEK